MTGLVSKRTSPNSALKFFDLEKNFFSAAHIVAPLIPYDCRFHKSLRIAAKLPHDLEMVGLLDGLLNQAPQSAGPETPSLDYGVAAEKPFAVSLDCRQ